MTQSEPWSVPRKTAYPSWDDAILETEPSSRVAAIEWMGESSWSFSAGGTARIERSEYINTPRAVTE